MLGDHSPPGFAPSRIKRLNHVDLDLCVACAPPPPSCSLSGLQLEGLPYKLCVIHCRLITIWILILYTLVLPLLPTIHTNKEQIVGSKSSAQTARRAATTRILTLQAELNTVRFYVSISSSSTYNWESFFRRQDWASKRRKQHEPQLSDHNKKGPAWRFPSARGRDLPMPHKLCLISTKVKLFIWMVSVKWGCLAIQRLFLLARTTVSHTCYRLMVSISFKVTVTIGVRCVLNWKQRRMHVHL